MERDFPTDIFLNRPRSAPETTLGLDFGKKKIRDFLLEEGAGVKFAEDFAHILSAENEKKTMEKLLNNVAANSNNLLSSKVSALDVQLVVSTTQQIKDFITDHFRGYQIKFKEPGEGVKGSNGVSTPTRRDFSRGFRDDRKPVKNFATTSHDMSFVMRLTLESILVRMMDIKERFLTIGMMYTSLMKRGLNCHCCYQLLNTETLPNGEIVEVERSPIPGNFSRISEAEHSLRKYIRSATRHGGRVNSVLSDFAYTGEQAPFFYQDTGLYHRCFRPPELCEERARQAITMFSAREFSLTRLIDIMHRKGVDVLYGAEAMSKSMLRFDSGELPAFEQNFVIDLVNDTMRVYNNDETNGYTYKYSTFRQFFFEQDIYHKGYLYAYRHEYVTSDVLIYAIRKMPYGTKAVKHSPVVDIRDDFVFLKTYSIKTGWNRKSNVKCSPMIISCHKVIYNQVKNFLTTIEKPDDEYIVLVTRYLRTINSEFVVNGKTFKSFEKLEPQLLNQVAVALFLEAIKEKLVNNTVIQNVLSNGVKLMHKRSNIEFAYEAFYDKMREFFDSRVPIQEIVEKLTKSMLNTSSDEYWSKDMVIEFFTYSHFIDNPYNEEAVGLARSASLTPFETMWYYHYRNEDVAGISWFEDLLKIDVEPSFSIVEDSIKEMDFSSLFTDEPMPPKPRDKDYVDDDEMEEILSGLDSIVESLSRRSDSIKSTESQLVDDANGYSEVPADVMVSDIKLPVLRPEEVLDAKEFKRKIRSADNLKEIDYANNIGIDLDYCDKYTKAMFEAYVYRKDTSACVHNVMCKHAMNAFIGPSFEPSKKVLDGQQMIKTGYNAIKFIHGVEVERYHRSSKKYSVGYLPYKPDMKTPCLQLRYNTERKLHEVRSPFSDYTGYLLVSDLTVVMNDENIANSLFRFDRRFNWPEQILMSAGAGTGKTHFSVENFNPNNFYVGSTKKVVSDLRGALKSRYGDIYPCFDFDMRVRTCDSINVNGLPTGVCVDDLYVDECFQSHYGEILRVIQIVGPKRVILLGDPLQIRFIDRLAVRDMEWATALEKFVSRKITMGISRRCPVDVARMLSDKFYSVDDKFGQVFYTTSNIYDSLEYEIITSASQVDYYDDVLYLTFTRADAFDLNEYFKKCKKGDKVNYRSPKIEVVDDEYARTVATGQGMDVDNVVLVRLSRYMDESPMSDPHKLVALSRHKKKLRYLSVLDNDPIIELIKYATSTDANKSDYHKDRGEADKVKHKI